MIAPDTSADAAFIAPDTSADAALIAPDTSADADFIAPATLALPAFTSPATSASAAVNLSATSIDLALTLFLKSAGSSDAIEPRSSNVVPGLPPPPPNAAEPNAESGPVTMKAPQVNVLATLAFVPIDTLPCKNDIPLEYRLLLVVTSPFTKALSSTCKPPPTQVLPVLASILKLLFTFTLPRTHRLASTLTSNAVNVICRGRLSITIEFFCESRILKTPFSVSSLI